MSHSDHHPDDTQDQFTEQLAALLARTAQDVQPNPDLARQVRERLSAGDTGHTPRLFAGNFAWLAPLGSVAVVALLLIAFAAVLVGRGVGNLHPGGRPGATPTSTAGNSFTRACANESVSGNPNVTLPLNPVDHSVAVGASATEKGITITLERAYADATQTVVAYSISPDFGYQADALTLVDETGARYPPLMGGASSPLNSSYQHEIFTPLPQSALGTSQRLTLEFTSLTAESPTPSPVQIPVMANWMIPFTITPVAGTAIPLSLPAQTHDGVTIQLEEMDVAPAGGALDGQSGGVRVRYRISNLPTTAPLSTATEYPVWFSEGVNAGGGGSAPGGVACNDSLTLTLGKGQQLIPGFIMPTGQYGDLPNLDGQTVGGSGSVEAEALFFAPIPGGNAILSFNAVPLSEVRYGMPVYIRTARGPWVFTAPLK